MSRIVNRRADVDRRLFLGLSAAATVASAVRPAGAQAASLLSVTVALGDKQFIFRERDGLDLGDYVSDVGGFTQRCVRATAPGTELVVYFRPDRDSERVEVVFELGRLFGPTPAHLGAYTATISRGLNELASVQVPEHYWFSRWRWQSAPRPIIANVDDLIKKGLLPAYDRSAVPPPPPPAPPPTQSTGGSTGGTTGGTTTDTTTPNTGAFTKVEPPPPEVSVQPAPEAPSQPAAPSEPAAPAAPSQPAAPAQPDPFFSNLTFPFDFSNFFGLQSARAAAEAPATTASTAPVRERAAAVEATAATVESPYTYKIMGLAGLTAYQPTTGEREDIGLLTERQALFVCTEGADALAATKAQAEAAGTMPWHMRDEQTGAPISFLEYPNASWYYDSRRGSPHILAPESPVTIDSAHQPAVAYLPFLLTGDPYFLEELQFQANWNWGCLPYAYRPSIPQTRSLAWNLRSLAQAAKVTPVQVPKWLLPQSYWQNFLERYRVYLEDEFVNSTDPVAVRFRSLTAIVNSRAEPPLEAGTWLDPWQDEFVAAVLAWMLLMGYSNWQTIFDWKFGSTLARTSGTSGWPRSYSTPYRLVVRRTTNAPIVADWREAWEVTSSLMKLSAGDGQTWQESDMTYLAYTRGALAIVRQAKLANVDDAFAWATQQLKQKNWTTAYKWRIGT